ncbi:MULTISPECIES: putative phage tail protein [unclassified Oceanobacter]|uniref:putative phage tail protein n=1 Tax=unclassified Oceanobacter TaxID=2620260 RepID=UPI0027363DEE|nr:MULTISPECIES: putative phage tail protein [unclassified Oceanobacter]MDP2607935.1 DUF2313 domain-containing protein [Oceanobacter sp. 1_MG-2023]MDP2611403.1 DUF2313 domain-containing protein [Oceanobacter sp. 2_MG-2023]
MSDVSDYQQQLLALLPSGAAWSRELDSTLGQLMGGIADEFARIDARSDAIAAESLPSQVSELIDEWEAEYGLPDDSTIAATTLADRRDAVIQKYQQYGSQSREFLAAMAAALGFEITITEYSETTFGGNFGGYFYGTDWAFVVQVNVHTINASSVSITRLERVLWRMIHAHKVLISNRSETNYLAVNGTLINYAGEPVAVTFNSTNPVDG